LESIAGGALMLWFALSALAQLRPSNPIRWLRRIDVLNLVIPYRFFGPDPRLEDSRVVSRRVPEAGSMSIAEWQPVWPRRPRILLDAIWNPRRMADYGFAKDSWHVASACRSGVPLQQLQESLPFKRLLTVVRHRTLGPDGAGLFEFRVALVRFGRDQPETEDIVFHSGPRA
jgi:hypothetical protein